MGWPLVAAIIGSSVLQFVGGEQQRSAQRDAAQKNSLFFEEQAKFIEQAGARELEIFEDQADELFGAQVGTFARAGVDISGSIAQILGATKAQIIEEKGAIKDDTAFRARLARLRAENAQSNADFLGSPGLTAANALSNIFGGAVNLAAAGEFSPGGTFGKTLSTGSTSSGNNVSFTNPNKDIFGNAITTTSSGPVFGFNFNN